jgi:hypothetical protein
MQPTSSRRERPDYDQALKRMLTRAHESFLQLIAPGVVWVADRSPELPAVARRADLVREVLLRRQIPALLHIELQTRPDADIGERLADYGIRLWLRDHLPVRSVVVFLRPPRRCQPRHSWYSGEDGSRCVTASTWSGSGRFPRNE